MREQLRTAHARGRADVFVADTGDLDAIRSVAAELAQRHDHVDALVHAAGALDAA